MIPTIAENAADRLDNSIFETRSLLALLANAAEADSTKSDAERSGLWLLQYNVGLRLQQAFDELMKTMGADCRTTR